MRALGAGAKRPAARRWALPPALRALAAAAPAVRRRNLLAAAVAVNILVGFSLLAGHGPGASSPARATGAAADGGPVVPAPRPRPEPAVEPVVAVPRGAPLTRTPPPEPAPRPATPRAPKSGKHRDPYDVNVAADEAVLDHLVFGPSVPKVYAQSALEHRPSEGGYDYATRVRVPRGVYDLAAEDEEGDDSGAPSNSSSGGGGTHPQSNRILTYRVTRDIKRNLPRADPSPSFRSCAVVGNAGTLLKRTFGSEIDKHSVVIRINNAPLGRRYDDHVGRRTHLTIINQHHAKEIANGREPLREGNATLLVYESTHSHVRLHVFPALMRRLPLRQRAPEPGSAADSEFADEFGEDVLRHPTLMLHPNFIVRGYTTYQGLRALVEEDETGMRRERARERAVASATPGNATEALERAAAAMAEVAERKYHRKPMTGFFAVLLAMQWCDVTYVYGTSPWKFERDWWKKGRPPYHYFDMVQGSTGVHSFDLATAVYKLMAAKVRKGGSGGNGKPLVLRG